METCPTEMECTVQADQLKFSHAQMCTQLSLLIVDQCVFEESLFTVCLMTGYEDSLSDILAVCTLLNLHPGSLKDEI